MAAEPLDPLQLLQEDLRDDDIEQVIACASRINLVAISVGPERTRNQLLPFIREFIEEDNDEAHTAIAKQLGDFIPLLGGAQYGKLLLPIIEKMCGEEEVVVRDSAITAYGRLANQFRKEDLKDVVAMIQRLAASPWFATRVSAAGLVPVTISAAVDVAMQEELRRIYKSLAGDETPMVRRAAYLRLAEYANYTRPHFVTDVLPLLKKLVQDPADNMRVITVDVLCSVADFLTPAQFEVNIIPLIEALEDDTSWRVRQCLSKRTPKLCKHVSGSIALTKIIPLFVKLLKDKEPEVRAISVSAMTEVGSEVKGSEILLAPSLEGLAADPVTNVRVRVANTLVPLCKRFSKDTTLKVVIPLLKIFAKDESYEVRCGIISEIDKLAEYVDPSALSSVFPLLADLSKDAKWRVRAAVIDKSSLLAKHMGVKKFEKQLQGIVVAALSDHVCAIREKACVQVGLITKLFGGKWAAEKLFPLAFAIYDKNTNYLYRMTCLLMAQHVIAETPMETIDRLILPLLYLACSDDVPNVRLMVARTFHYLIPRFNAKDVRSKITPSLQKLSKDGDADVSFFANKTLRDNKSVCF